MSDEATQPTTYSITVDKPAAKLLLELVTKAAVTGPDAATLANLYSQAKAAADFFGS